MLLIKKRQLRIAHLWYDDQPPARGVDLVVYNQAPTPHPGVDWVPKMTLVLDLAKTEEALFAEMKSSYRAKIRTAINKDHVLCKVDGAPDLAMRTEFCAFYDRFATAKGISLLDRNLLEEMAHQGQLAIAMARLEAQPMDEPLAIHAYLVYGGRVRLLHSTSNRLGEHDADRLNLIGRANRLLHWESVRWAREQGHTYYDFGGWYGGTTDSQRLAINQFKDGFGGTRITEYMAIQGVTLLGKLGVAFWKRLKGI